MKAYRQHRAWYAGTRRSGDERVWYGAARTDTHEDECLGLRVERHLRRGVDATSRVLQMRTAEICGPPIWAWGAAFGVLLAIYRMIGIILPYLDT